MEKMIATPDLIERLADAGTAVRRLRPPLARAGMWVALAAVVLVAVGVWQGIRPDLAERLEEATFVAGALASLVTGVLACVAAFMVSLPDRPLAWLALPVPALVAWLSTVGYGCLTDWVSVGPDGITLGETVRCMVTLAATSVPLALAALAMLRHAGLFRAKAVAMAGGLAVAGIAATALSLFHDLDASVLVLITNLGTAGLFVLLAALFGRRLFAWLAPRPTMP